MEHLKKHKGANISLRVPKIMSQIKLTHTPNREKPKRNGRSLNFLIKDYFFEKIRISLRHWRPNVHPPSDR